MKRKETIYERIDLFSKSFEFTFAGKDKFRSDMGGYITILTFFVAVYFVWLLGNEILYRNNPKDTQIISMRDNPLNLSLSVPVGFMVQDYRGKVFSDWDKYITFESFYWSKIRLNGEYVDVEIPKKLSLRPCESNDFSEEVYMEFKRLELSKAKCLDQQKQVLGGDLTSDFAKFITVRVTPCYNTTERNSCAPPEESFAFLNTKTLVISVKSEKIIYNSRDFKNPVKKFIGEDNVLADPFIFNFPRYGMNEFKVETDEGLIGQTTNVQYYYELSFLNDIISAFDNQSKMPSDFSKLILFEYSFFESSTVKTQLRSYLKLTDVLASLGGILKVYLAVFNFAFHYIYQRIMHEQIITKLFNFEKVKKHSLTTRKPTIQQKVTDNKLDEKEGEKIVFPFDKQSEKNDENLSKKPMIKNSKVTFTTNNYVTSKPNEDAVSQISNIKSPSKLTNRFGTNLFKMNSEKSGFNSSVVSAYMSKKKIQSQKRPNKIFSLLDHLSLSFFPCCSKCSFKLKNVNEQFNRLIEYMNNYIDVLQMMRQFHELERLKFVLFNKKQLAIFQNIGIPEDPFGKNSLVRMNSFYSFQYDHKAQKKKVKEFFNNTNRNNENDSKISSRLKKMFIN
jgi:hypothetical protein